MADTPQPLAGGVKIQIDYSLLSKCAGDLDTLRNNLSGQIADWSKFMTANPVFTGRGPAITQHGYNGSGHADLDRAIAHFHTRFTSLVGQAGDKMKKLSETFTTVAKQFLDNDLGTAAAVNVQSYQYLLSAWESKESAYQHYLATKDYKTTYQVYDEHGNLVTKDIPMWDNSNPDAVPKDPGAAPTSYTSNVDASNPLFMSDDKHSPIYHRMTGTMDLSGASITTHNTLDQGILSTNTSNNPPSADKLQSPVLSSNTTVSYDGGTYTENTTFDPTHKYNYTTNISHADGTTEVSTCTANPDGSGAVWTDTSTDTSGKKAFYKWTGDATKPGDRTLVDSPAIRSEHNAEAHPGGGGYGHPGLI